MSLAVVTDPILFEHRAGQHHPEKPERLGAVLAGLKVWHDAVVLVEPSPVPNSMLLAVHDHFLLDRLAVIDAEGGGYIDADTGMSKASLEASCLAAGAGLAAVDALVDGRVEAAFCAIRPPGHHATRRQSMGFCLINNVAVTARHLTSLGKRVAIVDLDAHHGNGTQDVFYDDPTVLFISVHQYPWYPGSGSLAERGKGAGFGTVINVPLPAGAAGNTYRASIDEVIAPALERFEPDWVLVSAGFDGHRADPLAELGLSAGDYHDLVERVMALAPKHRMITFLEGGYDLDALQVSTEAVAGALLGLKSETETSTSEGPGRDVVEIAAGLVADVPEP